jgi:hypothetical protein
MPEFDADLVTMVKSVLKEALLYTMAVWRFARTRFGEESVITSGAVWMLLLCVAISATPDLMPRHSLTHSMEEETLPFTWTMFSAQALKLISFDAHLHQEEAVARLTTPE